MINLAYYIQIKEDLARVWAKIDTPEKWTKHAYARDATGEKTFFDDPEACIFCISGAVRSTLPITAPLFLELNHTLISMGVLRINPGTFPSFNDDARTTHFDVKTLFTKTMERVDQKILELTPE